MKFSFSTIFEGGGWHMNIYGRRLLRPERERSSAARRCAYSIYFQIILKALKIVMDHSGLFDEIMNIKQLINEVIDHFLKKKHKTN